MVVISNKLIKFLFHCIKLSNRHLFISILLIILVFGNTMAFVQIVRKTSRNALNKAKHITNHKINYSYMPYLRRTARFGHVESNIFSLVPKQKTSLLSIRMMSTENENNILEQSNHLYDDDTYNYVSEREVNITHLLPSSDRKSHISPYWIKQLQLLQRPTAQALVSKLTPANSLGYEPATGTPKKGTLLESIIQWKTQHTDKVILTRVGEFYEAYGIDALMLINYAGLNSMAGAAKAGCPIKNIQATLDSLTTAGLSIAVYEEIAEIQSGRISSTKAKLKNRVLSQVISPACSTYIYNNMCLFNENIEFKENYPAIGLLHTVNGYILYQIYIDTSIMIISERLTEEGVQSILSSTGFIEPVYIQDLEVSDLPILESIQNEKLTGYSATDFSSQLLRRLSRKLEINTDNIRICNRYEYIQNLTESQVIHKNNNPSSSTNSGSSNSNNNVLMPIYTSTALQIGLLPNINVPDLVPHLLPSKSSAYIGRFLRKWLLNPPPAVVADAMRDLCRCLLVVQQPHEQECSATTITTPTTATCTITTPTTATNPTTTTSTTTTPTTSSNNIADMPTNTLPTLPPPTEYKTAGLPRFTPLSIAKVVSLINAHQCNVALFREIRHNIYTLQVMLESIRNPEVSNQLSPLIPPLLLLTSYESGVQTVYEKLYSETIEILKKIDIVIPQSQPLQQQEQQYTIDACTKDPNLRIPNEFFELNERDFRNKVIPTHPDLVEVYKQLDIAAVTLCDVVATELPKDYVIHYDTLNNAIVVRNELLPGRGKDKTKPPIESFQSKNFIPFYDRKGKITTKSYTTEKLQLAISQYLEATAIASNRISEILQNLSIALQGEHLVSIVQAGHWAVILESAALHIASARQKGWVLPEMLDFNSKIEGVKWENKEDGVLEAVQLQQQQELLDQSLSPLPPSLPQPLLQPSLQLTELSPYWMDRSTCTLNPVHLHGIYLLTAPNMSGKSTLMRSVLVAALLANCGLCVPCSKATVPR